MSTYIRIIRQGFSQNSHHKVHMSNYKPFQKNEKKQKVTAKIQKINGTLGKTEVTEERISQLEYRTQKLPNLRDSSPENKTNKQASGIYGTKIKNLTPVSSQTQKERRKEIEPKTIQKHNGRKFPKSGKKTSDLQTQCTQRNLCQDTSQPNF